MQANKKTRNKAYDIIVQIGHACGDEDRGGKKEHLLHFFNMVHKSCVFFWYMKKASVICSELTSSPLFMVGGWRSGW